LEARNIRSWGNGPGYLQDLSSVVDIGDLGSCELHGNNAKEFEYRLDIVRVTGGTGGGQIERHRRHLGRERSRGDSCPPEKISRGQTYNFKWVSKL